MASTLLAPLAWERPSSYELICYHYESGLLVQVNHISSRSSVESPWTYRQTPQRHIKTRSMANKRKFRQKFLLLGPHAKSAPNGAFIDKRLKIVRFAFYVMKSSAEPVHEVPV